MTQSIANLPQFRCLGREGARVTLASEAGYIVEIMVLEQDIVHVLHQPREGLAQSNTWAIAPGFEDVPDQGRGRRSLEGFACPNFQFDDADATK